MPEEGRRGRFAPAKSLEDFRRGLASTESEDGLAEATARFGDGEALLEPRLFERGEGVGGEHLSPLVGVVARGVAPLEDVREAAEESVLGNRREHRGCGPRPGAARRRESRRLPA